MNLDRIFNVVGAIVTLAGIAVVVGSPHTASLIRSFGAALSDSIDAATRPAR